MPDLVLNHIGSYLDVKSMLSYSLCKKEWAQHLDHEDVIKAAIAAGGNAAKTIEIMFRLCIIRRVVYLPSPLRLLKLANGRACEMQGCMKRVKHVRAQSGLFLCEECHCKGSIRVAKNEAMFRGKGMYLAARCHGLFRDIRKAPFVAVPTEVAGPILTLIQLLQQRPVPKSLWRNNPKYRMCGKRSKQVISRKLRALSRAKEDGYEWRANRLIEKQRRVEDLKQRKLEKCYSVLRTLRTLVASDSKAKGRICFSQRRHWTSRCSPLIYNGPVQFRHMMNHALSAPSRCTYKQLKAIAKALTCSET